MSSQRPIIQGLRGAAEEVANWIGNFNLDIGLDPKLRPAVALFGGILGGIFFGLLALLLPARLGWWRVLMVVLGAILVGLIFYWIL